MIIIDNTPCTVTTAPSVIKCISFRSETLAKAACEIEKELMKLEETHDVIAGYVPQKYHDGFSFREPLPHSGGIYKHISKEGIEIIFGNDDGQLFINYRLIPKHS